MKKNEKIISASTRKFVNFSYIYEERNINVILHKLYRVDDTVDLFIITKVIITLHQHRCEWPDKHRAPTR